MTITENKILSVVKEHKKGRSIGIPSICSANDYVIKAALRFAAEKNTSVLIESTSNQVDQFGGYTGLTPEDFKSNVYQLAREVNFPSENIILGGDHLGPNVWQSEDSESALKKAEDQITAYLKAGYTKIHLDTSMKCADDGNFDEPLETEKVAERAARLCKVAEKTFQENSNGEQPVYIIGSDVPPPGGAKLGHNQIKITTPEEVQKTIDLTKEKFEKEGLQDAWQRVIAVVVQPGVEFSDEEVFEYKHDKAENLINKIREFDNIVYEAHSTDYQLKTDLKQMVKDHFVILKVGPWLTYAMREAIFILAIIEEELLAKKKEFIISNLIQILDAAMIDSPKYWQKYFKGSESDIYLARKYSYSDRIRYYWTNENVKRSLQVLIENLKKIRIPNTLLSNYLPEEYEAIRLGKITNDPEEFIYRRIRKVLKIYHYATNGEV